MLSLRQRLGFPFSYGGLTSWWTQTFMCNYWRQMFRPRALRRCSRSLGKTSCTQCLTHSFRLSQKRQLRQKRSTSACLAAKCHVLSKVSPKVEGTSQSSKGVLRSCGRLEKRCQGKQRLPPAPSKPRFSCSPGAGQPQIELTHATEPHANADRSMGAVEPRGFLG
jgi:hypothetical protein